MVLDNRAPNYLITHKQRTCRQIWFSFTLVSFPYTVEIIFNSKLLPKRSVAFLKGLQCERVLFRKFWVCRLKHRNEYEAVIKHQTVVAFLKFSNEQPLMHTWDCFIIIQGEGICVTISLCFPSNIISLVYFDWKHFESPYHCNCSPNYTLKRSFFSLQKILWHEWKELYSCWVTIVDDKPHAWIAREVCQ